MGNIRPSFIKIRAIRLCEEHGEKFTDDFDHNKHMVSELTDVSSKARSGQVFVQQERKSRGAAPCGI